MRAAASADWECVDEDIAALVFGRLAPRELARARLACTRWSRVVKESLGRICVRGPCVTDEFPDEFPNVYSLTVSGEICDATLLRISRMEKVEYLELYDTASLHDLGRDALAAVAALPRLRELNAYSCGSFRYQNVDLFTSLDSIRVFTISDDSLGCLPKDLKCFSGAVFVHDHGLGAIAALRALVWLDLGYSIDTFPGWLEPLAALRLRALNVNDCDYCDLASVRGMTTLENLDASESHVSPSDLDALATLTNLTRLDLACAVCQDTTTARVAAAVQTLRKLRFLNVHNTQVDATDAGSDARSDPGPGVKAARFLVSRRNAELEVLVAGERSFVCDDFTDLPPSLARLEIRGARLRPNAVRFLLARLPNLTYLDVRFSDPVSIWDLHSVPQRVTHVVTNKKLVQGFIEDKYPGMQFEPLAKDEFTGKIVF